VRELEILNANKACTEKFLQGGSHRGNRKKSGERKGRTVTGGNTPRRPKMSKKNSYQKGLIKTQFLKTGDNKREARLDILEKDSQASLI